jgi:hypothetical protein
MRQVKASLLTIYFAVCAVVNSCSQTTKPGDSSTPIIFEATTPCKDVVKTMLHIPTNTKCEMMRWTVTLLKDQKTLSPSSYKLTCVYGIGKQGTRGFMEGAETIELAGKLTIEKGIKENKEAVVYKLTSDNSPVSLSFLKLGENLLHLLDIDKHLMVGNGAWSYTFNRIHPVVPSSTKLSLATTSHVSTGSDTVGVFDGRTPCSDALRALNGISTNECQIIKCRLALFQDSNTHNPTGFLFQTIYVGAGDTKYSNTGKWKVMQGLKNDPSSVVYQLDFDKPQLSLALVKADDNILYFLDEDKNLMVGNTYTSYTLNRNK